MKKEKEKKNKTQERGEDPEFSWNVVLEKVLCGQKGGGTFASCQINF
jgi:hypothetical protein